MERRGGVNPSVMMADTGEVGKTTRSEKCHFQPLGPLRSTVKKASTEAESLLQLSPIVYVTLHILFLCITLACFLQMEKWGKTNWRERHPFDLFPFAFSNKYSLNLWSLSAFHEHCNSVYLLSLSQSHSESKSRARARALFCSDSTLNQEEFCIYHMNILRLQSYAIPCWFP